MSDTPQGLNTAPSFVDELDEAPPLHQVATLPSNLSQATSSTDKPAKDGPDVHQEAFDLEPGWYLYDAPSGEFVPTPLKAFTVARQSLARRLNQGNAPISAGNYGNDIDAHASEAWAVLWLCMHEPEEWRELRADVGLFWETIETWAEVNCPRPMWVEAVTLVFKMWEAVNVNQVIVKRKPGKRDQGK